MIKTWVLFIILPFFYYYYYYFRTYVLYNYLNKSNKTDNCFMIVFSYFFSLRKHFYILSLLLEEVVV